ncbi:MAG: imelysin family protein [Cyanobacteria bacterium P01_D01_bin.1]
MPFQTLSQRLGIAFVVFSAIALADPGARAISPASAPDETAEMTPETEILAAQGDQLSAYVESYAELVYQTYSSSKTDAVMMQGAIADFLAEPSAETHQAAKAAWTEARQSYLQTEAFRFYEGPIDFVDLETGEEGPEGRINAWPMNEAFIDYVQGKADSGIINDHSFDISIAAILENDQVSDEADVTTGWHAIEFLLWGQDFNAKGPGERSFEDFVAGVGNNDRRRAYLALVTDQLVEDLTFLETAWQPDGDNYRAEFVAQPPAEAVSKILTSLATLSAFEMASERMAVSLDSGDQEDEHSCFSDTTHQDFVFNSAGIRNVYFADYADYQGTGLDELLGNIAPELNQQMIAALDQTQTTIGQISEPFDQVLASAPGSDERAVVESAITALEDQADLILEVGSALGVEAEILAE